MKLAVEMPSYIVYYPSLKDVVCASVYVCTFQMIAKNSSSMILLANLTLFTLVFSSWTFTYLLCICYIQSIFRLTLNHLYIDNYFLSRICSCCAHLFNELQCLFWHAVLATYTLQSQKCRAAEYLLCRCR